MKTTTKTTTVKATGHYILVAPMMPKTETEGGILLTPDIVEAEKMNISVAQVIDVGPYAYKDRITGERWPNGPWCEVGDWVVCPKFGTKLLSIGGVNYSILNDDEIMAVVDEPSTVKAYI